jgi:hypothetical protein
MARRGRPTVEIILSTEEREALTRWAPASFVVLMTDLVERTDQLDAIVAQHQTTNRFEGLVADLVEAPVTSTRWSPRWSALSRVRRTNPDVILLAQPRPTIARYPMTSAGTESHSLRGTPPRRPDHFGGRAI